MDCPERNYSWSAEYRSLRGRETWNVSVKKGGERNGGGWKAAGSADGATKLLKILVDLEQPDLSRVSSTRSSSTLSLVYSCVPSHFPSRPFIIEHRVIRHVSHGPLFFQSCRFLLSPLGPFRTTAGDQSRERERKSWYRIFDAIFLFLSIILDQGCKNFAIESSFRLVGREKVGGNSKERKKKGRRDKLSANILNTVV